MKFTVSFNINPVQGRDISESIELISSLFKQNASELEHEIINLKTDVSLKTRANDTNSWNLVPSAQYPVLKRVLLNVNACFGSTEANRGFQQ
jgi:hypothetical protein